MKKYLFFNKKVIIGYSLMAIVAYCFLTLMYKCYSWITNVIEEPEKNNPITISIICVGVLVVLLIFLNFMSVIKRKIIYNINVQFRNDIFSKSYNLGYSNFFDNGKEYFTSILLNDLEILQEDYFANVIEFIGDLFQLIVMLASIAFIGIRYLVIVILFAIPSCIHPFILKKRLEKNAEIVSDQKEIYTKESESLFKSFLVFKTYRKEKKFNSLFNTSVNELETKKTFDKNWKVINSCLMAFCVYILKVGSQLFFTYSAINGLITVATVTLLLGLANNVGNPFASLLNYISAINSTKKVREKCSSFLSGKTADVKHEEATDFNLKLDHVTFMYSEEKTVLDNISFTFEKGKKYVIFGPSGCGKSTLFQLILGHIEANEGKILVGNKDIRDLSFTNLHRTIACISQTPFIFSGTIRDNITMFHDNFSDEEIWNALNTAGIKKLVEATSGKLDEQVEVNGNNFSGGEKQRLSIARAILFNSPVLLIDEGMSALDNETADIVESNILQQKGKTIIAISHRIQQSLKLYDEIILMDGGKIVETGNYNTLMEYNSAFKDFIGNGECQDESN